MTSQPAPEVLCIGETMSLIAPRTPEPLRIAEDFGIHLGGAESNVALYLHELGLRVAWVSRLGADPLGDRIVDTLIGLGLDLHWVERDPSAPTAVYLKDPDPLTGRTTVYYYRRGSAASHMSPELIDRLPLDTARLVHLTGITPILSDTCQALVEGLFVRLADQPQVISFDVNYRPALWTPQQAGPVLLAYARRADLVFVGLDEAETLWGTTTAAEVAELVGPEPELVIKDGAVGATSFHRGESVFVPALPVEVVEAVGAGDAFAAGYLEVLLRGGSVHDRLQAGHRLASRALSSIHDFVPEPR